MADIVVPLDWDDEAQNEAMKSARELQKRDPEAAALLLQTLIATRDEQERTGNVLDVALTGYDPVALYEMAAREYGWTPMEINKMHYLTFFAMIMRTADLRRKEKEEVDNIHSQQGF